MPKPFGYVSADFLRRSAERMTGMKQASYALLELDKARRVLDVGCGPGVDTVGMAAASNSDTEIIGIDIDEHMIREADAHAKDAGVSDRIVHVLADAYALPFDDASFDACRAERVFQNIPANHDTDAVLGEMLRVLRPGGRIVLIDTDFATSSVDYPDTDFERKMMQFCATSLRPNGLIARRFYRMLKAMGMRDVLANPYTVVVTDPGDAPFVDYLAERALEHEWITRKEAETWIHTLNKKHEEGMFFASLTLYMVSAVKP